MKKKTKTIGVLLTGIALAVGIAVSGGVIHNSHIVDEVKAETGTITLSNIGADVGASLNTSISLGDNLNATNRLYFKRFAYFAFFVALKLTTFLL